ncbi:MAG TPA: deoxyribose-phosphate aldolase [Polyangiaceae bacterium]
MSSTPMPEAGATYGYEDIASMIDHALLAPSLDWTAVEAGLRTALAYRVASVCVVPHYLAGAAEALSGSNVRATTTIGFPHGTQTTATKLHEAELALADGAVELDAVVNVNRVLSLDWSYVTSELRILVALCHEKNAKLKLIFENCYLGDFHKIRLCELAGEHGADWVKTSTGFGSGGATLADLRLMREHAPPAVQVKASGGIRTLDELLAARPFVTRVGLSRTPEILEECRRRLGLEAIHASASNSATMARK